MTERELRIGIVGAGGRGGTFRPAIEAHDAAGVHAVCDVDLYGTGALEDALSAFDAAEGYHDYDAMLVEADLDAVVIGTPIQHHATQAIAALERDCHVLSEVPAGVGVGECRDLVEAGLFGEVYYAEGEYLHERKGLMERTTWRRTWGSDRNGITYPTHGLGPILEWFGDDRVARVTCAGSGHHYTDPRGEPYGQEDTNVVLCETETDRLIELRYDTLSERPHALANYELQGIEGCFESARAPDEPDRVWLAAHEDAERSGGYAWRDLADVEHLPERWRTLPEAVAEAGHGGADYFVATDFLDAVVEGSPPPIGIHAAMDMTLPGIASVESAREDGAWVDVPDSRAW